MIRAFYQRLRASGKAPKLALTAAMRKLLVILLRVPSSPTLDRRRRQEMAGGEPAAGHGT